MRWSKLKQPVEDRMADSLQRRVEVHTTWYRCLGHDKLGRTWITVDKHEAASMSDLPYWNDYRVLADEIRVAKGTINYRDPEQRIAYYAAYDEAEAMVHSRGSYSCDQCNHRFERYLLMPIDDVVRSGDMLVRALAMLDRRLGKRRLREMRLSDDEHPLA
jgi:hypothetical protein